MRIANVSAVAGVAAAVLFDVAVLGAGQQPPPIQGVTGTIATDTSIQETTAGGNKLVAAVGRMFGLKRSATLNSADEALGSLKPGTRIVLQYAGTREGGSGASSRQLDGAIESVNRGDRTIAVTLDDGTRQTLRITDPGEDGVANVFVYYKDRPGTRIARAFKRVS
jgi:hypothetical protein